MFDETMKQEYRDLVPPKELKARVLSACRSARKKRAVTRRRWAGLAACLVVVISLSVYGFSPVPTLSSGDASLQNGTLALSWETVSAAQTSVRSAAPYGIAPASAGEDSRECIALTVDRAAVVEVSAGTLYVPDADAGTVTEVGGTWKARAGEELYWYVEQAEGASITLRAAVRSTTLHLTQSEEGWSLQK